MRTPVCTRICAGLGVTVVSDVVGVEVPGVGLPEVGTLMLIPFNTGLKGRWVTRVPAEFGQFTDSDVCPKHYADLRQQIFQRAPVNVFQRLDFGHCDVLIDLVNRRIGWAELDYLRTDLCDEAAIGRTAGR